MRSRFRQFRGGAAALAVILGAAIGVPIIASQNPASVKWYVAPAGSDSNTGTDASHPFATLGKAYRTAACGDVVQLAGTFTTAETIFETSHNCPTGTYVTFRGPATFTGATCGAEPCNALAIETSDIRLTNATMQQTLTTNCCGANLGVFSSCGTTYGTQNVKIDNVTGTRFTLISVKNVTVADSTWSYQDDYGTGGSHIYPKGGCADATDYPGDNIGVRVTHNTWVQSLPTSNCAAHNGGSACHLDCLTISSASPNGTNPGDSVWVDRNTFKNCNAIDVWWKRVPATGMSTTLGGMLIENNDLQASVTGAAQTELNCPDLSSNLVENSAYRYNSLQASGIGLHITGVNCTWSNVKIEGNVMPGEDNCGQTGLSFGHNFVLSGACSGDTNAGSLGYVDSAGMDLHLANGAAAISGGDPSFLPAVDFDGNARPIGTVDAGAHERG